MSHYAHHTEKLAHLRRQYAAESDPAKKAAIARQFDWHVAARQFGQAAEESAKEAAKQLAESIPGVELCSEMEEKPAKKRAKRKMAPPRFSRDGADEPETTNP